ncbi:MAG: ABC transporter ATP-binding protein [Ardenticatenaceae bacterium]|nr:ABC transporter ATP-binding protein [Ardenticatenaceae bacterium]
MFLNLDNLSKIFPARDGGAAVRAVDQVSLEIEKGELVTLLGPSGCGKTTTLRLIAGFEFPTEGRIVLDGEEINDLPPNMRDMAMVFQSYAIFPHLNVYENIAYGLKIKRLSRSEVRTKVGQVMDMTELTGLENRAPNQLSGGQQQRVALARALVMEPKVLLFDEPLSNLDAKLRVQMRTEIRRIQKSFGITSIYVTHDQDEAMALSDRIVIMDQGRIQQADNAIEIYRRPANRFVADFIGQANFLPVEIVSESADKLEVQLNKILLQVPKISRHEFKIGDRAQLLLRPESVRVQTAPQANAIPGTVRYLSYLGSVAEYDLEIENYVVAVKHYDPRVNELHEIGESIYLELVEENLYLLPQL